MEKISKIKRHFFEISYLVSKTRETASSKDFIPWIVLINGHTRANSDFNLLVKKFNNSGFNCLLPDNRDAGKSRLIDNNKVLPYNLLDMAEDIIEICKIEKIKRASFLGISMGGLISQVIAFTCPSICQHLIIAGSTCKLETVHKIDNDWPDDFAKLQDKMSVYYSPDFYSKYQLFVSSMLKQIIKDIHRDDFRGRAARQREAMALPFHIDLENNPYKGPVLIIHGKDDKIIPSLEVHDILKVFPQAQKIIFDKTGHFLIAEKGLALYKNTIDFIRQTALTIRHL